MDEKNADRLAYRTDAPVPVVDYPQIGKRIRRLRKQALAEAASLSVPFISHLEQASKRGTLETLVRIAAALGVTANELLGISFTEEEAFLPDMMSVLSDCSPDERKFLPEVAAAIKKIMRQEKD